MRHWLLQTKVARNPKYLPDFSKAFKHVLIHPGAKIVIDQVRRPAEHRGQGPWLQTPVHAEDVHTV